MRKVVHNVEKETLYKNVLICKDNLDKKINEEKTIRDFIKVSENTFGMVNRDVDSMNDVELKEYVAWLDYLWEK